MTLNFNVGNFGAAAAAQARDVSRINQAEDAKMAKGSDFSSFSVTRGTASPEDIAGAAIGEDALRRDDPLGNLVKSAYNLPPPPPPWEL